MKNVKCLILILALIFICSYSLFAQTKLTVQLNKPQAEIQSTMWGVFFEDINFAADGGIYAELVKNRSFEFNNPLMGWKEVKQGDASGKMLVLNQSENNPANPRYLRVTVQSEKGAFGLANEGFRGMGVKEGAFYDFSVIARNPADGNVQMKIELIDSTGAVLGQAQLNSFKENWKRHSVSFQCSATSVHARLNVLLEGKGTLDLDMISLFPRATWKNRPNGLRADLVQMLADLKPGFIRFPGGCIVEGHHLDLRYQWKKTIGNIEDREVLFNRWNTEFMNRHAPDYYQSFGLGFYEYFLLAEDLGAEPLPILNCGMACQFNTGEVVPLDQLDPYIQDFLDLIEFANGSPGSKWGEVRAMMGHPKPFNLKYLGIGNEQWGEQYIERYRVIAEVVRNAYPKIKLVSGAGPFPEGDQFGYLWSELKNSKVDLVDEHYYRNPDWFLNNARRYDNYDRKGKKVFAGEYASHGPDAAYPSSKNTWLSALTEAAFMTGLERNADVVQMASYAPLFGNVDAWQWRPNLIWFDNLHTAATPNYYVQKLFSNHRGTHTVPVLRNKKTLAGEDSLYASGVINKTTKETYIKIVNAGSRSTSLEINLEGAAPAQSSAQILVMTAANPLAYNSLENPLNIVPVTKDVEISGKKINLALAAKSFTVIVVKCKAL